MNTSSKEASTPRLYRFFLSLAFVWSMMLLALAGWDYRESYSSVLQTALSTVRESYDKDLVFRQWATMHGGVYVPVTPQTPPNPYLAHIPERDISTPSGKKLTLMNPAYMTRQIYELEKKDFGALGHITSLNPIRPENSPDEWETRALQLFEKGQKEVSSIEPLGKESYLRLMRPLITGSGCLRCHAVQGYKVGDIRGGISVSLPWSPFHKALWSQLRLHMFIYGWILVIGILGLYLAQQWAQKYLSARQKAEEALRESEYFFKESQRAAFIGSYETDFTTGFWKSSEILDQIFGIDKNYDRCVQGWLEIVHPDDREMMDRYLREEVIAKRKPFDREYRIKRKSDGEIRWVNGLGEVSFDNRGNVISLIGTIQDITDQKRIQEENRNLQERLQRSEKMEALGTLAGGVAHDLNNVLGVIVGFSEILLDSVDKSSPLRHGMENVMNGGLKAAAIVEDLLTLARRGVQGRSILNLNKIIAACQESPEFANLSSHHPSVKIIIDLETDLLNISGSSLHLGKTLYNLISNAGEAMPKGGTITIRTTNQYLDKPIQGYDQIREGDYVVLSVADTGEGISANDLKRIFEPFYTKKIMGRSGTGLGLAVVWGTAKDHNGYINVQSDVGKGSTFSLYFPVTREEITTETAAVQPSEYRGKGESILIVDDVKEQRDLASTLLATLNYSVASVSGGEDAVAYFKEHDEVDLMVLDMIMDPGMDGLDTYKSVLEIRPKQKAIIVSGFSESDRIRAARELGAGAYVRKPYIKEKLGIAVRKELDRK